MALADPTCFYHGKDQRTHKTNRKTIHTYSARTTYSILVSGSEGRFSKLPAKGKWLLPHRQECSPLKKEDLKFFVCSHSSSCVPICTQFFLMHNTKYNLSVDVEMSIKTRNLRFYPYNCSPFWALEW